MAMPETQENARQSRAVEQRKYLRFPVALPVSWAFGDGVTAWWGRSGGSVERPIGVRS